MKNYKAIFERLKEDKVPDDLIVEIQELFVEIKKRGGKLFESIVRCATQAN